MKHPVKILLVFLCVLCFLCPVAAAAENSVESQYTFNFYGDAVPSPPACNFSRTISGADLGIESFKEPEDFFIDGSGLIYVADTGNNRIVVFDKDYSLVRIYETFVLDGAETALSAPSGLFVDGDGSLYIADTKNERVLVADSSGNVRTVVALLPEDGLGTFQPLKVLKDVSGNLCVIAGGVNEGIMHFSRDGKFLGFMGAPRVKVNLADLFWRNFMTVEQKEKTSLVTPVIYSNMDVDGNGVIYTTIKTTSIDEAQKFRKLSPGGYDITRSTGEFPPNGDIFPIIINTGDKGIQYKSNLLVDVISYENGVFSLLDQVMGRIFTYDEDGNLLYAFGNKGNNAGAFSLPVAIEHYGNRMFVLDKNFANISVFTSTAYGDNLHQALETYKAGDYVRSIELYEKITDGNINSEIGYIGLGRNKLMTGDYKGALEAFRVGNYRYGYSEAFDLYRRNAISENFIFVFILGAVFVFGMIAYIIYLTRENAVRRVSRTYLGTLRFSTGLLMKPFDGFNDLKNENRGSIGAAATLLAMFLVTYVVNIQYAGFLFNTVDLRRFSLPREAFTILFAVALWIFINSAVSVWIYGEGKLRHIFMYTCYALTPMIIFMNLATLLSNLLLESEGIFYYFLFYLGIVWFVVLLLAGNMQIHQYSGKNSLVSVVICLVQIAVVLFLILVGISLYQQVYTFVETIFTEISLR